MAGVSSCPDAAKLQSLLRGESVPGEARDLEIHLDGCPTCQELLTRLDSVDSLTVIVRAIAQRPAPVHPEAVYTLIAQLARFAPDAALDVAALLAVPGSR